MGASVMHVLERRQANGPHPRSYRTDYGYAGPPGSAVTQMTLAQASTRGLPDRQGPCPGSGAVCCPKETLAAQKGRPGQRFRTRPKGPSDDVTPGTVAGFRCRLTPADPHTGRNPNSV